MSFHWSWEEFCGRNFSVWNEEETGFSVCFELVGLVFPVHIIFATVSAFYIGNKGCTVRRTNPHLYLLWFRFTLALLMSLCPLVNLFVLVFYIKHTLPLAVYVVNCFSAFAWILHVVYIHYLKTGICIHSRGPRIVRFAWFLTFLSTILHVYSVLKPVNPDIPEILVGIVLTYFTATLQMLYVSSLIPKGKSLVTSVHRLLTVNVDEEERSPLLTSGNYTDSVTYLQSEPVWSDLGVALEGSGVFSKLMFGWVQPLIQKGVNSQLWSAESVFELPHSMRTSYVDTKFWILYKDLQLRINAKRQSCEVEEANSSQVPQVQKMKVTLFRALLACFGREYFLLGILKFFADAFTFAGPLLLNSLLEFIESESTAMWKGYLIALGLFGTTLLAAFLGCHFEYHIANVALKIRAAVVTTVYRKTLYTSSTSLSKLDVGEIVNYMSTDSDRIQNFCPSFHQFWSLPLQIIVCLFLLYTEVGVAFLAGVGFAVVLVPINRWLAVKIGKFSTSMMEQKDKRVKLMNEILKGVNVIKFYAWEKHFKKWIDNSRKSELHFLKLKKYLDAGCVYFWVTTPIIISLLTFVTYVMLGNNLTAAKVFTCIALVNLLVMPFNAFPWVLNGLVEAWVSLKRIERLLQLPELNFNSYYTQLKDSNVQLRIKEADFVWNSDDVDPSSHTLDDEELNQSSSHTGFRLRSIDLDVLPGQLVAIVGQVGSGKSSLLQAILAEVSNTKGEILLADYTEGFGYVPQQPWIQQGTIRSNILFGKSYDSAWYQAVLYACSLEEDLQDLPAGDETEIGERGVTLSGGQKTRIALARAVYQDKSFYLLDDPLAAVDVHVANHLFDNCIMDLLKKKTCILCTHQLNYAHNADVVVLLENGKIIQKGLASNVLPALPLLLTSEGGVPTSEVAPDVKFMPIDGDNEIIDDAGRCKVEDNDLIQAEERETGTVKMKVYQNYCSAVGYVLVSVVLLMITLMQGTRNATDGWLAHWVSLSDNNSSASPTNTVDGFKAHGHFLVTASDPYPEFVLSQHWSWALRVEGYASSIGSDTTFYLTVYGILVGANSVFTLLRAFLFAYGGVSAATSIHKKLLHSLFLAPVSFFERNPLGRILNRFSSDLYAVDDSLPFIMNILLAQSFGLLGTIVIACYGLPWILLLIIPLFSVYLYIQEFYRHTSREVKRLSALTLSPIYAHFSESLAGLTTIRAFRAEARFRKMNEERLEKNQRVGFAMQAAKQWLNLRLQMIGVILVTGVGLLAVLRLASASLVGLALSNALIVTRLLNGVVYSFTETEKEMVNAERVLQYIEGLGSEKWQGIIQPPLGWPRHGAISFRSVYLQYRENLPYSLQNVSFEIGPAEKIGIVGRTGAGKTSIFKAIFRLVELDRGSITIDGVNIGQLDLTTLRFSLAVIPQDPFVFCSSVRNNLDPAYRHGDTEIWEVLQQCCLSDVVDKMGGLDSDMFEHGYELSVGQKQLLCLARALLTKAKVLCIDEATANVDIETDRIIQQTIRTSFANHTVLTIAHRIDTIMDCDRILVMSHGKVEDLDSPQNLLQNKNSSFYKLKNKFTVVGECQ